MKTIKRITVIMAFPPNPNKVPVSVHEPPCNKRVEEILNENRKLRCENEVLRMQLAGKDHYANNADRFLRKLAGELKENGFC